MRINEVIAKAMKPKHVLGKEKSGAVEALEKALTSAKSRGVKFDYDKIDAMMQEICKNYNLTGDKLHKDFVKKHNLVPDNWIKKEPSP
jgi:ABC-type proline/glycine betaine transport system substrate-binding protein